MYREKGFGVIILIVSFALVSIAVIGSIYFAGQQPFIKSFLHKTSTANSEKKVEVFASATPTKEWKKFSDTVFNFSLEYPTNYYVKDVTIEEGLENSFRNYFLNDSEIINKKNHKIEINILQANLDQVKQLANIKTENIELETDIYEITILGRKSLKTHNKKFEIKNINLDLEDHGGEDSYFIPLNDTTLLEINYFVDQEKMVSHMIDSLQISNIERLFFTPQSQLYALIYPKNWNFDNSGGVAGTDCGQFIIIKGEGLIRTCVLPKAIEDKNTIIADYNKSFPDANIKKEQMDIKSHNTIWVEGFIESLDRGLVYVSIDNVKYFDQNNQELLGHLAIQLTITGKQNFVDIKQELREVLSLLSFTW